MPRKELWGMLLQIVGLLALLALAISVGLAVKDNPDIAAVILRFGYPGLFVASLISGFNLVVPIPIATFIPAFLNAGMDLWLVVLTITLGTTIADSASYIIGRAARTIALSRRQEKMQRLFTRLQERHSLAPIIAMYLFASFVPLPNEVAVIPLAMLGFRFRPIVVAVFLGNLTFNTLVALGFSGIFTF